MYFLNLFALIENVKFLFRFERYGTQGEFAFEALLVNLFAKTVANFTVNFKKGATYGVRFVGKEKF